MKKIAAFDIGSNAIRMAIGEIDLEGKFHLLSRVRAPIRLGAEVFSGQELSQHTRESVIKNFVDFRKSLEHEGVIAYKAVATSALRNSSNGKTLIEEVFKNSGIKIDLIDGQEEAAIIRKALQTKIDLSRKDYLLFDIGGGSAELSILKKGEVQGSISLPMGAVRLLEIGKAATHDGLTSERGYREYLSHLNSDIQGFLDEFYPSTRPIRIIGTGGNFKRLSRLRKKILGIKNIEYVLPDEVAEIREVVEETPLLNRTKKFGLRHDRADVIVPAIYIIENIMSFIPIKKIYTPDIGLIHGVLFRMADQMNEHLKTKKINGEASVNEEEHWYRIL